MFSICYEVAQPQVVYANHESCNPLPQLFLNNRVVYIASYQSLCKRLTQAMKPYKKIQKMKAN